MPDHEERPRLLLVEDNDVDAALISRVLADAFDIVRARTLGDARSILPEALVDIALLDFRLPDGDGLALLDELRHAEPDLPVVFVTAANDAKTGIAALRGGAEEFVVKDTTYLEGLSVIVHKAIGRAHERSRAERLRTELRRHKRELDVLRREAERGTVATLLGDSDAMRELGRRIDAAARSDETVLVTGETGVGKELVARAIHARSGRASGPFVAVNCATLPESIVDTELFGYKRGAFTGAERDKGGYFHAAVRGTLFLDEIGELSPVVQAKLLRVLQEGEFTPIGSVRSEPFGGRVLAATNQDLESAVKERRFRSDLYYRLNVLRVCVPPLRDRRADIPRLAECFLSRYNARNGTRFAGFAKDALAALQNAAWPGNVRELENFVYRMLAMTPQEIREVPMPEAVREDLQRQDCEEAARIATALERNCWNRQNAAEELGMSRTTLWRKMQHHCIGPR